MRTVQDFCEYCVSAHKDGNRGTGRIHGIVCLCGSDVAADREYKTGYADTLLGIVNAARAVLCELPQSDGRVSAGYGAYDRNLSDLPEAVY